MRQRPDLSAVPPPAPAPPAAWLGVTLPTVEQNLALDEALLELAHDGLSTMPCVRTWMATEPAIVLGSSSRVDEEVDRQACAAAGVRVVRRPSGGATVVLGPGCLMWSVITPHPEGASQRQVPGLPETQPWAPIPKKTCRFRNLYSQ